VSTMSLEACAQVVIDAFEARFVSDAAEPPKSQVRVARASQAPPAIRKSG
jgi:hypothetical protein